MKAQLDQANAGDAFQAASEAVASACPQTTTPTAAPASGSPATSSGDGGTQQYYNNGFTFVGSGTALEGLSAQEACTKTMSDSAIIMPVAGGNGDDSGTRAADQAAWLNGCEAVIEANTPSPPRG